MGLLLNLALILGLLALKAQAQDAAGKDGDSMEATDSTRCIYCKAVNLINVTENSKPFTSLCF